MFYIENAVCGDHGSNTETQKRISKQYDKWAKTFKSAFYDAYTARNIRKLT